MTNRSGAAIPANARVVIWSAENVSEEYASGAGEGTVDAATNRFSITFDREVPEEALLGNALGIGFVVLTTDPSQGDGVVRGGRWHRG